MADYYPLIARAVDGLTDKSPLVRRAVYERARNALLAQLQSLQPPVAPADIERERASLDLAIGSVEALYVLPSPQSPIEAHLPPEPSQVLLEPLDTERNGYPPADAPSVEIPGVPPAEEATPEFSDSAQDSTPIVERPRIGSKHHSSGQANRVRAIILVASVVAVVIGIASYKLYDRGRQTTAQVVSEQDGTEQPDGGTPSDTGKFADRLGGGVIQETVAPAAGGEVTTVAIQKAVLFEIDPATLQLPSGSQKIIASEGLTKWSLEQVDAGEGKPLETVVHGEVDFPQVGFKLDLQIRKNNDGSSVAHIMTLRFSHGADDVNHTVVNINKLEMKDAVIDPRGNSLSVRPIPIAADLFMLGMSDIPSEIERNTQLLQSKNWFGVDLMFSNGQRGAVSIEKGPTGFQVIADAIRRWQ